MCLSLLAPLVAACGPSDPFPPGTEDDWLEAREPCRLSHDHDLTYIRVWADDAAYSVYTTQEGEYPVGARLLKGMYRDELCEELFAYVTMEKLPAGTSSETWDWDFRRYDAMGNEIVNPRRIPSTCVDCHAWHCPEPPYGLDLTCAQGGPEPPGPPPGS